MSKPGAERSSEHGDAESSTTERITVGEYQSSEADYLIYVLHAATYAFARSYVEGKRVLDFGCGTGYGTAELAKLATEVVGVDIAAEAVDYATTHYGRDNLAFHRIGPVQTDDLPFDADSFDVVVSFQVIEHVDDVERYLHEIKRVLRPGGQFLCVTPDRRLRLFPGQRPWNEFHVTEYSPRQLEAVLQRAFPRVELLGMTAGPRVLSAELRRYRRSRLLTYPVTFPGIPDRWRLTGVRLIKRLLGGRAAGRAASTAGTARTFDFGPEDVVVAPAASPSVNIVAVVGS
ncbi:class I SAM-dependent methyltransferase [Cellulomonas sp. NPDC089187]|uniref:class I SAM-dependent methyltransferase n=1 Tax=Cellulomonas sp. NPDC089187 TaxID=3154970 RepID=UPI003412549D